MSISKALNDNGWKDFATKSKIKDNGLLKLLIAHKRLDDDKYDESLASLDQIVRIATQLKKAKEVSASPAASKYVAEVIDAAGSDKRVVAKASAEVGKKVEAEARKRKQDEQKGRTDEEGEEAEDEPSALLTTKMLPLLRQVNKGETMYSLVASNGKNVVVMLSRKPIAPARRKLLANELGGGGGIKYFNGHCMKEEGATTFALKTQVAGMAKKLKLALLEQTGLRVKLRCRGEDGATDDDLDEPAEAGEVRAEGDEAPEKPTSGGEVPDKRAEDGEARTEGGDAPNKTAETGAARVEGGEAAPTEGGEAAEASASAEAATATGMTRPFELRATVGRGGKNVEEDVKMVQAALNRRMDAGLDVDGRCGPAIIEAIVAFQRTQGQSKPDGRVDSGRGTARALAGSGKVGKPPPPPSPKAPPEYLGKPSLERAPMVWHGTRDMLDHNIAELKYAIKQEYANEHPQLVSDIDQGVQRVDAILEKLDTRLAETLECANATKDQAQRTAELANAKAILKDYVAYVKSEPLIDHVDKNPFGVNAQVRKTITDSLIHMIKSIASPS